MKDILLRNTDDILRWLDEVILCFTWKYVNILLQRDVVVVDRGFRDCVSVMQILGLDVMMSPFLDGRRQFSTEEANQSRCITIVRWVVEAANRRIKQFKYFANTVQNSSLPYLESDLSLVCALINRYHQSINISKPEDVGISQKITQLLYQKNQIQSVNVYF